MLSNTSVFADAAVIGCTALSAKFTSSTAIRCSPIVAGSTVVNASTWVPSSASTSSCAAWPCTRTRVPLGSCVARAANFSSTRPWSVFTKCRVRLWPSA
jgi:hypothetical protein